MNTLSAPVASLRASFSFAAIRRIVLIGFMGAGKSTLGRLLAAELGWGFVDTDREVERQHGCSIARMFAEEGEAAFRKRESLAVARALGQRQVVIALGGGAPEVLTNRLLLEQTEGTAVVYLQAPFEVLFDRCVLQEGASVRPVLLDAAGAADRFRLRAPFYQRSASHVIRTGDLTPETTVERVLSALCERQEAKSASR